MNRGTGLRALQRPKKNKDKKLNLISQEDFYEDGVKWEEQAERWLLSDLKKALRFYKQAYDSYDNALAAESISVERTYDVLYNQTRLLFKIHTDYMANDGHINLLKYVNLQDIDGIDVLLQPIERIVDKFEVTLSRFAEHCTWDLYFNLLTCYSSLLDGDDVDGSRLIDIFPKFTVLFHKLVRDQLAELGSWNDDDAVDGETGEDADMGDTAPAAEAGVDEYAEVRDHLTPQTLVDTIVVAFKFVESTFIAVLEDINDELINPVQKNLLQEYMFKFESQLQELVASVTFPDIDTIELALAMRSLQGLNLIAGNDLSQLEIYISGSCELDHLLQDTDLLQTALVVWPTPTHWRLYTLIASLLGKAQALLSSQRGQSATHNNVSPIVFQLCDVMLMRSDVEFARWALKKDTSASVDAEIDAAASQKMLSILQKNGQTLLNNVVAIAEKPCGMREYVTDKLKRNYIYRQATSRQAVIAGNPPSEELNVSHENPYYRSFITSRS
ncbi:LAMI_0F13938g1_1 [Lachancea mirantina]|uniref:LAMI_0F13938g1_1 n=1 Tax=Lachancea mirantina TaxID=1230905 RepID=A0A1G4K3K5_9SACH|nr:LAMI_0F13938g1_1 [Lachancea mirantina]